MHCHQVKHRARPVSAMDAPSHSLANHRPVSNQAPSARASWAVGDNLRAHLATGGDKCRPSAAVSVLQPLVESLASFLVSFSISLSTLNSISVYSTCSFVLRSL